MTALAVLATTWVRRGSEEFEDGPNGRTGWARDVDGRTADGRWPETYWETGEVREGRATFPDSSTEMRADQLPVGWLGFVGDNAANLGMQALEGRPGFVNEYEMVYAVPADGRRASLTRETSNTPSFKFQLPPGEQWGNRSAFWVVFPNFYHQG